MTDDEMAKLHVRYMVGGQARGLGDERLYRFEFPERPGALLRFLQAIGSRWNISLFHYRNHGSDYGRVLAGIQVPPATRTDFLLHMNDLQYAYTEETDNPAYRMFLAGLAWTIATEYRVRRAPRHETVRVRTDMHLRRWGPSPSAEPRRCCCCTAVRIRATRFSLWWTLSSATGR